MKRLLALTLALVFTASFAVSVWAAPRRYKCHIEHSYNPDGSRTSSCKQGPGWFGCDCVDADN